MTKIVAFEGIDGTGKSVQMERLAQRLRARGKRVLMRSFPMYDTFFGSEVGKLLTGKGGVRADEVDGKSMALWFALDRFEAFRNFDFHDADVLLINRYVLSNAVYQSIRDRDFGSSDLLDFVLTLEHEHFGVPRPNVHVVFDMATENASENVSRKGYRDYAGNEKDLYEAIPDIQQRARHKYLEYAQRLDNVLIIPCMEDHGLKSIEAIGQLVDAALADIL